MKISEKKLISEFKSFLQLNNLVFNQSHFGPDDETKADVELALNAEKWPDDFPEWLIIEAKSHHSKDSPNTINKIFGQLLKETGKRTDGTDRSLRSYCLGILFPSESAKWNDSTGRRVSRPGGEEYYRAGFKRIKEQTYIDFGHLVNAKYILSFSSDRKLLRVFDWKEFLNPGPPVLTLPSVEKRKHCDI
jgi:hypothetical protein